MNTKILVIDNTLCNWSRCQCLREEGYHVDTVLTPDDGLHKLTGQQPDVIIVQEKPGAQSWQLCEQIRHLSSSPLMVISPNASVETSARAIRAGADYFMRHYFGPLEFSARVKSLLRRSSN
ncbi:MAG: response regulator [Dehalococcoidales bacterium]|nr:response regulator [Dehalococcoidales bacterium]